MVGVLCDVGGERCPADGGMSGRRLGYDGRPKRAGLREERRKDRLTAFHRVGINLSLAE